MYRVLVTGAIHPIGLEALKREEDLDLHIAADLPISEILKIIEPYHCIITRSETPVQKELIDNAPNLKIIARAAVGIANIDVEYATKKGILVIHTPGKNTNSAAELTMGLLLSIARKIVPAHQSMQESQWNRHRFTGTELLDKTIGIIGLGNVGHRVAQFANGFDMKVLAYDPYIADEVFDRHRAQKSSWEDLITNSDIISLHVPRNDETIGMIDAKTIAQMKDGVVLLNLARGGVVNEGALQEALATGKIASSGVDTWEQEPPVENPLKALEQVVMTPHIGASTIEAQMRVAESIASQVPRALRGEVVDYPVNMPRVQVLKNSIVSAYLPLVEKIGLFASQFMEFAPDQLTLYYRGSLAKQNCSLLRLSFLKGFLKSTHDHVSYVNVEQLAQSTGLNVQEEQDLGFTDYESAFKCVLSYGKQEFIMGGVVFSGPHPRITLINNFVVEFEAAGTILVTTNYDCPGMVGVIGMSLGKHEVNISQFELARNIRGGEALSLIRGDGTVSQKVISELLSQENIRSVRKIEL